MTGKEFRSVARYMRKVARRRALGKPLVALIYFNSAWWPIVAGGLGNSFVLGQNDNRAHHQ